MNTSLIKSLETKSTSVARFGFKKSEITDTQATFLKYNNVMNLAYVKTTYSTSEKDNKTRRTTTIVISDYLKNRLTEGELMILPLEIPVDSTVQSVVGVYCNPKDSILQVEKSKTKYKALKFKKNSLVFPRSSKTTNYGLLNEHFKLETENQPDDTTTEHLFRLDSLFELTKDERTLGYDYFKTFDIVQSEQASLFDKMETMKIETEQL